MLTRNIVRGQEVSEAKAERAREMRRAATAAEQVLWQALRGNKLSGYHFRRQQVIDGFVVDFYCNAVGLVIEVDGGIHSCQKGYDTERDEVLCRRNLHVLRFSNDEVLSQLSDVVQRIEAACRNLTP
jgi:very-short-patch-repair endonuclease